MSKTPRLLSLAAAVGASALVLAGCSGAQSEAAPETSAAADSPLYEAAKEEGKVVVYENVTPDIVEALRVAFMETYPGIEVEAVRLPDSEMVPRLETELSSGAPTADLIENASPAWLKEQGAAGAWIPADLSPQASGEGTYDTAKWYDPETNVYEVGGSITTFAWNTDLLPDGLEDYTDLTDPALADGQVGVLELSSQPSNDFYIWLEETFGEDFYTELGAQKPRIYPSTTGIVEALGSGEIAATNWIVPSLLEEAKAAGAPVDYAISPTGIFGLHGYAVINAEAEHPAAAQLYLDWLLSEEGQAIMWPTASSVLDPAPEGVLATNDQLPPWNPEQSTPEKVEEGRQKWDGVYR